VENINYQDMIKAFVGLDLVDLPVRVGIPAPKGSCHLIPSVVEILGAFKISNLKQLN